MGNIRRPVPPKINQLVNTAVREDNMPKSKLRGGAKQHRQRVKNRNKENQINWQKAVNFAYQKHNELKAQAENQPVEIKVK